MQNIKKLLRKRFVFGNIWMPICKNRVNLFYWRYICSQSNVGDLLSKVMLDLITNDLGLDRKKRVSRTKKISAIGSIIQILHKDTTIWGSGSLTSYLDECINDIYFDIRAVRGPKTKELFESKKINCPSVFGDPAILLPLFYKPADIVAKYDYVIIPHYSKLATFADIPNVLSPLTNDWRGFVDKILSARFVISSSLHGIILAESYGIPAIFLDDIVDSYFKYDDYYYSTNRFSYKKAKTVEEAIKLGPEKLPENLDELRFGLLRSFPIDLFEGSVENIDKLIESLGIMSH